MCGDPGELWAGCALHVIVQKDRQRGIMMQLFLPIDDSVAGTYRAGGVSVDDTAFSRDTCKWLA